MTRRKSGSAPKRKKTRIPRIALRLPKDVWELYARCLAIWTALKADPAHFPAPYPTAAEIDADLAALYKALQDVENGGGTVETTGANQAAAKVRQTFELVGKYVQKVVRAGPIEEAPHLIASVNMFESNIGAKSPKPELEPRDALTSGMMRLIALAVPSAVSYDWYWSSDQVSWTRGAETAQSYAFLSGLTPGKTYYFRFSALLRDNTRTEPSQVVSWMVK